MMFSRIAVVNRGESAMRLIHAVRELNATGGEQIETVALYTDAERTAMFVREADHAYPLGPASARPYLDLAVLERALRESGADAAWVGWGFVAEDPAFAELCDRIGVTFIGPSAEAMRRLGDKIGSKLIAEEVGVPVAPWSRGAVDDLPAAIAKAAEIGYPLMLKATAGGGGRGIRVITSDAELTDAFDRTRDEAARAFGSGVVFLERLVTGARHVEVQVIADGQGTAWALGVRDCSVQRRNQKVIEESASPVLDPEQVAELKASAERLALAVDYRGAGTVEFLYHPGERLFAFLEVNTRLQVEHPITEVTTDVDLVKAQLHVAAGGRLEGDAPVETGHAVEARLNAEDPDRDFAPSPGRIALLALPAGPGIRVDTGVAEGDTIPADFDSMIAKIIAYGRTRDEALARLRTAMSSTTVVIEGGSTNKSFMLDLLDQPEVKDGSADTGWIDRVRAEGRLVPSLHSGIALVAAGIEAYEDEEQVERARLLETAHGGRPQVQHEVGRAVDLKLRGTTYRVTVTQTGPHRFRVAVGPDDAAQTVDAEVERLDDYHSVLVAAGRRYRLVTATHGPVQLVEVEGVTHRVSRDEGGVLRAPAPALVVATPAQVGEDVAEGAPVLVLESMKMETVLNAPFAAKVRELLVSAGSQVETGAPLVRLEPVADEGDAAPVVEEAAGVDLDLPVVGGAASAEERARRGLADLTAMLLGFDVDPQDEGRMLAGYLDARDELTAAGTSSLAAEVELLGIFADFAELSRNRPASEEVHTENRVHSPREHFHTYLQSLDVERGGLPDEFRARLAKVLAHYGVTDLDRTAELEEAVFRAFLAQQRSAPDVLLATALLQRWIDEAPPSGPLEGEARTVLDRLVVATQLRFPVVGDLARSVRFRWFDQPLVDEERTSVLTGVRDEVAALAADPDAPDRAARLDALARIPEQIVRFLAERLARGVPDHEPMLEVLIRRHYREHELHDLRSEQVGGRPFAIADYTLDERPTHLVTTVGTVDELAPGSSLAEALAEQVAARGAGEQAVVDLYLGWPGEPGSPDETSAELARLLGALPFAHEVRRVAVAVCPGEGRPVSYFSFRPEDAAGGGGLREDDLVRGLHPMVGRRLNLWRLREFDVTRLEAPEDVLLYHCVAPGNPADQRLVALAQVRQLAVVRDESGKVTSLPHAERAVANCLEAIRRARTERGAAGSKLDMNHVWVQIWPVIEAELEQLTALQQKIAPLTVGAGIEEVLAQGEVAGEDGTPVPIAARFSYLPGSGVVTSVEGPPTERLKPLDDYAQKVLRARRRGTVYPYELQRMVAGPGGSFTEHDLDDTGALVPVDRPRGLNKAGIIAGVVSTPTDLHPEGIQRVVLSGDPTRALGAVSEAECARINAALDLAERMQVPVEWYALSAGARISMDSGTENMDWVARGLKRIIEFTQAGGEINIVVAGINVGAQPYWNAEATMLMHTKGILVMTPDSAMVLTGKQSLDFSGGVSAEDNYGIGGYDRVMGPNGQAQYWAPDLAGAYDVLMAHYRHTYVVPGEASPRRAPSSDPIDRDVTTYPHDVADSDFRTVGDIFSATTNPDRKKAFDIRTLMRAVADQDHPTLERWAGMADADTAVVQDAHLGGWPVLPARHRVAQRAAARVPARRRAEHLHRGHAVPAVLEEGRAGHQRGQRQPPAGRAGEPLRLRRLARLDAQPAAGVRRGDRPGGRQLRRADRVLRGLALPRRRVRGVLQGAEPADDRAGRRGLVRLGHRWRAGRGGGVRRARSTAAPPTTRGCATWRPGSAAASGAERAGLATELAELRASVRAEKLGEVAAEFDARPQHPPGRRGRVGGRRDRARGAASAHYRRDRGSCASGVIAPRG